MMKKRKLRGLSGVVFLVALFILYLIFNTNFNAKAALTDSTDLAVLKDAPDGIGVGSYMSNAAPTVYDSTDIYNTNSAQIVDHSGANSSSGNVVSLASAHNTYGSMWSTEKNFDINKKQTISAWLYFGSGNSSDDVNSEGIAFVLQNDSKGIGALGAGLEGMGVYGYDASKMNLFTGSNATQDYIKNTAIQNSVALEFDTSKNNFYDSSNKPVNNNGTSYPNLYVNYSLNGFDTQLGTSTSNLTALGFPSTAKYGAGGSYGHIALAYPGLADTYQATDLSSISNSQYDSYSKGFVMVHIDSTPAYLVDDQDANGNSLYWHHVTITWTPPASGSTNGTLSYAYNDISKDGLENTNTTNQNFQKVTKSITVDTSKLNSTDGKVRWGFTAANGSSTSVASKLVAFDSIPDLLYADAEASIVDNTLHKTITDDSSDKTVATGDDLSLNYNLKYISGNEDWKNIAANIKIPDNVTVTPDADGNVAYITYADGTKEAVSSSQITNGSLQYTLAKMIGNTSSAAGTSAQITISGTAKNDTTSDITVKAASAKFSGTNNITTTSSPVFTILAKKSYTLKLANAGSTNDITLLYQQDNATLDLPTELTYSDSHSFGDDTTSTNIIYTITVDDHTYTVGANASGDKYDQTINLKDAFDSDSDFWNIFTENSTKTVTVKAIDQANGLISNTITYNVNTTPNKTLSMTVSNNLAFKDINQGDTTTYLQRKSNFDLSVTSLREPWQLSVETNGLYNGTTLNQNMALVYKKSSAANYQTLSSTPTMIDEDTTSHETSDTDNIASDWTNSTGLLLKQLGTSTAGTYTGTLTWTVADAPTNN